MSFRQSMMAMARGNYGQGKPARPIILSGAMSFDPVEAVEQIATQPMPEAASTPRDGRQTSGRPDQTIKNGLGEGFTEQSQISDHLQTEPEQSSDAKSAVGTSPPDVMRERAGPPKRRMLKDANADDVVSAGTSIETPRPYLSYEAALIPVVPMPQPGNPEDETPAFEPSTSTPFAPDGLDEHRARRPEQVILGEYPNLRQTASQEAPQQSETGSTTPARLEIGELSIKVLPPDSTTSPTAPRPRGVPISASAALRRAGVRRL